MATSQERKPIVHFVGSIPLPDAETVFRTLHPFCDELRFDREPQLLATANVWHLSTRFRGRLKDPAPSALELAATLHPTPAVCGEPRAAARC